MGFGSGATDIILGIGAVLALVTLVRSWHSFVDRDFSVADRRVAMQVAVFLVPPAVVLFHELGHAAAVALVGAEVTDFHYGLFEGSVSYVGSVTPTQMWFVSLAGNLVGIGIGVGMVLAGALLVRVRQSLRYLLIVGGLIEAVFALVGYPLISLSARFGDWLTIYDFDVTPVLSWSTLVVHVAALGALWLWWKRSLRRTLFAIAYDEEERLAELTAAVRRAPAELEPRIALANLFASYGDLKLAAQTLDAGVAEASQPARLHLARARVAMYQERWTQALLATQAGLAAIPHAGDGDLAQQLWANQGVALAQLGRSDLALTAFGHLDETRLADPRVRYCRGLARLASGDVAGGRADLAEVATALPASDLLRRWAQARLEGRDPDPPDDGDRPVWARRQQSPPAPISGV